MNRNPLLVLISILFFCSLHVLAIDRKDKVSIPFSASGLPDYLYVRGDGLPAACFEQRAAARIRKATLHTVLDWKSDDVMNNSTTEYQAALSIKGYSAVVGGSLLVTYTHTLTVKSDNPQSYVAIDFTALHATIERFEVTATYSLINGTGNIPVTTVMQTDAYFTEEYEYAVPLSGTPILVASAVVFTGNEATFKWDLHCPPSAPNYQFQLLRLFNNDVATSSSETTITTPPLDWSNALTIETGNSLREISLTLAEGTGYYIWRVRPIGNTFEGGAGNDLNWGVWSTTGSYTQGNSYVISAGASPYLFFYTQFDDGMNWIFGRSFIEGDAQTNGQVVISENMNYANGLQMATQQQTRLKAEKKKLVGQTVYDFSGRAALTSMAAPVNDNTLGYISGYVKNALGNTYSAADFDADANYQDPPPFDMNTPGPGKYYSNNNDLESDVPTAEGYAYSRTLFMNDGTSQPKEQSSPGPDHKLSTTTPKHTTRNFSSAVADIELITLFGDEAPDARSVMKNITTDANNGSSVSYVSKEGQTIATCLSSPGASNLDPLTPAPTPLPIDYYLNNNSSYGSTGLIASKTIVLTEPTSVSISYSLTPNVYEDNCVEFCATCDYKVTIRVVNNENPSGPLAIPEFTVAVNPTWGTGDCSASATNWSTTVTLPAGSFTVERTIEAYQTVPLSAPPTTYIDQLADQIETAMHADFNSGTAVIVDDLGVPVPGAPSVNMATLRAFIPSLPATPDLDGLYTYLAVGPTQDHVNLQIGCNTVVFPILRCASDECPVDNDFEKYFTDWYHEHSGTTTTINMLMPQYSAGEFNMVIANMINCGGYDCKALYSCWRAIVSSYESINGMQGMDLSASYNGYSMPSGTTYTPNYLDMFLDCAGYKLVGIENDPGDGDCSKLGYKFHPYAYFSYTSANRCTNCESTFYLQGPTTPPNPLTAPTNNSGSNPYTWASETDFALDFNASGANYEQMKLFFDCIQLCNTTGSTPTFTDFAGDVMDDCIEHCEGRYEGFVTSIIDEYHHNNVHVEGDQYQLQFYAPYNWYIFNNTAYTYNPSTDIPLSTIYCQAQGLVEACKTQCVLTVTTTSGQTTVGTPAEIEAMANAMYGAYDLEIPSGGNCPSGYSPTATGLPSSGFLQYAINALNGKLSELRASAPVNGYYWNFNDFLINSVDASFTASKCDFGDYVLIHPEIPSYFAFETAPTGNCRSIVYYFNRSLAGPTLSPKRLYSIPLLPAASPYISDGLNYISSYTISVTDAMAEQITTGELSYIINPAFSPLATSVLPLFAMDLTSQFNAEIVTEDDNLYGYTLANDEGNGFYKVTLCSEVCNTTVSCPSICYKIGPSPVMPINSPEFEEQGIVFTSISCEQEVASQMLNSLDFQVGVIINDELAKIRNAYRQECINELVDETKISYSINYHHFTLYYYDRAGNLVKTVPPEGVKNRLNAVPTSRLMHPDYPMITEYAYNSLHSAVRQKTPDGGETKFWYNAKAMLRFSQNLKQLTTTPSAKMSFTKYDDLGRVVTSGEMPSLSGLTLNNNLNTTNFPPTATIGTPSSPYTDITMINYSDPPLTAVAYFGAKPQRYLQNRVSYGYTDKDGKDNTPGDRVYTYYSYDPHGNVEWLIQDIPEIGKNYMAYEYDLISGSVLKVKYNEEFADKFFHRYSYDESKRLKTAETSKDGIFWEKDASYKYYLHGPLKRAEIGHDKIQGLDYTYTIMGWLKGLNHIDNGYDPGKDGNETGNTYFAKDVYGMQLGYYEGDYISKSSRSNSETTNPYYLAANSGRDLYNGNISAWTSNYDYAALNAAVLPNIQHNSKANGRVFTYDELNRITRSAFKTQDPVTKLWSASLDYAETFSYDANGNFKNVIRKGYAANPGGVHMDDFTYNYVDPVHMNQLSYVSDLVAPGAYSIDIDDQTVTPTTPVPPPAGVVNYMYDKIGNLIGDWGAGIPYDAASGLGIYWNPQGKVSKIKKADNTVLEFLYDMMGRRVYKKAYNSTLAITDPSHVTTYYVLDASGNSMAIYNRTNSTTPTPPLPYTHVARFDLSEQPIYGSDRIGERTLRNEIYRDVPFISGGQPAAQGLPTPVHISAWPQMMIPIDNTSGKQVYNRPFNSNSGTNTTTDLSPATNITTEGGVGFAMSHDKNQALVHDCAGNPLLTAYAYTKTPGFPDVPRIFANGSVVGSSNLINSSAGSQSVFVKRPGSTNEYFYITIGTDSRPYFHTIDVSSAALINYNNQIDNATIYSKASMAVIDNRLGTPVVYISSFNSGQTTIKMFTVNQDGLVAAGTPVSFNSSGVGAIGDMQISANGMKLAIANIVSGTTGEIRMYSLGADHLITTSLGQMSLGAGNSSRSVEFTHNDLFIYFTRQSGTTQNIYRQLVVAFAGGTVALPGTSAFNVTGTTTAGMIRRGSSNKLYFVTKTTAASTTPVIYMVSAPENGTLSLPWSVTTQTVATSVTNGSLPVKVHVIDEQALTVAPLVYDRLLDRKVYELKDHLGNVHATIGDYKKAISPTDPNVKVNKKFDNGTTEGFTAVGTTTVTTVNNQLSVTGTLGSAATISFTPIILPAGKYVLSFDYSSGNTSLASYKVVQGTSLQLKGYMSSSGRQSVAFEMSSTLTTLSFTCEDALTNRTFYIDNVLIKAVTTTMVDPIVTVNDNFSSGGNWVPDANATVSYPAGVMQVTRVGTPATLSIGKDVPLMPGLLYKINFDVNALNLVGGTLNFEYRDNTSTEADYSYLVRSTNGSGSYTYYFVPAAPQGNLSFAMTGMGAGTFSLTLDNIVVTQYENNSLPLYTAQLKSLTDYYAFGAPMPGRQYSAPTSYRYGFNGQEKDNEVYGEGNLNTAKFWEYDTRLGRRWNVDPRDEKYPYLSPYVAFADNPMIYMDRGGDTLTLSVGSGGDYRHEYVDQLSRLTQWKLKFNAKTGTVTFKNKRHERMARAYIENVEETSIQRYVFDNITSTTNVPIRVDFGNAQIDFSEENIVDVKDIESVMESKYGYVQEAKLAMTHKWSGEKAGKLTTEYYGDDNRKVGVNIVANSRRFKYEFDKAYTEGTPRNYFLNKTGKDRGDVIFRAENGQNRVDLQIKRDDSGNVSDVECAGCVK
jgi:hypothetical protein